MEEVKVPTPLRNDIIVENPIFGKSETLKELKLIPQAKQEEYIKENLHKYNMYVYPSIFEETFCISLLECMAAGLYCITTNLGALYETGAEFPMYIPVDKDYKALASKFGYGIEAASQTLHNNQIFNHLDCQSAYANSYYNWNKIGRQWETFLKGALDAVSK